MIKDEEGGKKKILTPQIASSGQSKSWGLPGIHMDGRRAVQELVQDLVPHLWRSPPSWIWKDGAKYAILPCRRIPEKKIREEAKKYIKDGR